MNEMHNMWKRFLSLVLSLMLILGTVRPAKATEDNGITFPDIPVLVGEKDVGSAISPMKKGDKAPFSGVLLSPKAVATIIAQIHAVDSQIKIEIDRIKAETKASCDLSLANQKATSEADKKILQAQLDAKQKLLSAVEEELKKQSSSRSYTPIWVGLGVISGVGITLLTVFTVSRVNAN